MTLDDPTASAAVRRAMAQLERRTVSPHEFLRQAREVPWSRRSQGFWDLLAILGGATSGYLWFVYSSVRGLPLPRVFSSGARESWFDFFPTLALLALPAVLVVFRRPVAALLQPLWMQVQRRNGRDRLVFLAVLSCPFLVLYLWPSLDRWVFPRLFQAREGVDLVTPLLTTAIPLALVWFRRETDALLRPLQPLRTQIPGAVLIGMGLVAPFLVSGVIYGVGRFVPGVLRGFFIEYPYLRLSVVFGTLVSYAILRTPRGTASLPGLEAGHPVARVLFVMALAGLGGVAAADDFFRDPFNLNDGLRTNAVAPVIAGVLTTVITVLVNGAEVARVILQGTRPPGAEGEDREPVRSDFRVVVDTVDGTGARSTRLDPRTSPFVFLYAHCEELGKGRFPAGDATIGFSGQFDTRWAVLEDLGTAHGRRCARVSLVEPRPGGAAPGALTVLVSAGQAVSGIAVTLTLAADEWVLELR